MKLILDLDRKRIVGTAKDSYTGPSQTVPMPADFDETRIHEYVFDDDLNVFIPEPVIDFKGLTEKRLDDFVKTRDYSSVISAASYISSNVEEYRADAAYVISSRDETWKKYYELMNEIESGTREKFSTYEELESLLPVLAWPEVVIPEPAPAPVEPEVIPGDTSNTEVSNSDISTSNTAPMGE